MLTKLACVLAFLASCSTATSAQARSRSKFAITGGLAWFDGSQGEAGAGLFVRASAFITRPERRASFTIEVANLRYHVLYQACALIPGATCTPKDPPASVWSIRLGLQRPLRPSIESLHLLFGLGVYTNVGAPAESPRAAAGLDLGLGLPLGARLGVDLRFVYLYTNHPRAWTIPFGMSVRV